MWARVPVPYIVHLMYPRMHGGKERRSLAKKYIPSPKKLDWTLIFI